MKQTSLKSFGNLISKLDQSNATTSKVSIISEFIIDIDPRDGAWVLLLLMGNHNKRLITGRRLREILQEASKMPRWLFDDCFTQVGDSAETISLLWPQLKNEIRSIGPDKSSDLTFIIDGINQCSPLHWWMETLLPTIKKQTATIQSQLILELWKKLPDGGHYLVNKLMTGGFRIGVSKGLVVRSIVQAYKLKETSVLERLMTPMQADASWFEMLTNKEEDERRDRGAIPYPFYLASPIDIEKIKETPAYDWIIEYKWDGIRGQLIRRQTGAYLWSRGEELVNDSFPEIMQMADNLPRDTVLDGEILCWDHDLNQPMPFSALQRRLGRKKVGKSLLKEYPTVFMAYDILENQAEDLRSNTLKSRLDILTAMKNGVNNTSLLIDSHKIFTDWNQVNTLRDKARKAGAEGLMIKKIDSEYLSGRKRGNWWKYKHEPMTLDAVLLYAQAGTGKRANLFTDYTFALWNLRGEVSEERELVTFAKAYSGLNHNQIAELDRWIRTHTLERYGPTRVVEPKQVFEIAFEGVMESKRHKCGLAVRFPRIKRWRIDKVASDADCIEQAQAMINIR